jgi:hypothetical protein
MNKERLKTLLAELGACLFGLLVIYMGYLIIFEGQVPARFGYHSFQGIERLLGIFPIAFGGLVTGLMLLKFKHDWFGNRDDEP